MSFSTRTRLAHTNRGASRAPINGSNRATQYETVSSKFTGFRFVSKSSSGCALVHAELNKINSLPRAAFASSYASHGFSNLYGLMSMQIQRFARHLSLARASTVSSRHPEPQHATLEST